MICLPVPHSSVSQEDIPQNIHFRPKSDDLSDLVGNAFNPTLNSPLLKVTPCIPPQNIPYDSTDSLVEDAIWKWVTAISAWHTSNVALLKTGSEENETDAMIFINTGTDGTIMLWDFNPQFNDGSGSESSVSSKPDLTAAKLPIHRIWSKSELGEFTPKAVDRDVITGTPSGINSANSSPPRLQKRNSALEINNKNLPMTKIGQGRVEPVRSDSGDSSTWERLHNTLQRRLYIGI